MTWSKSPISIGSSGSQSKDALAKTPKLHLAKMMVYGLQPTAEVRAFACKWQENPEPRNVP